MASIFERQEFNDGSDFVIVENHSWWWTRTGQIVRWSIFFGLLFLFFAYMIGGYMHAKSRMKKGLPPLKYHRWLLNRQQRARFDPNYQNPSVYYSTYRPSQGQYGMQPMPPPMYDPSQPPPPTYQPPAGASKVDPSQWRAEPTRRPAESGERAPEYEAPPGPPPAAALQANNTGTSNNPYRM